MHTTARTAAAATIGLIVWLGASGVAGAQQYPEHCEQLQETSGFVDDDGCPISREEFERMRERETGMQWGNIAMLGGGVAIVAAGGYAVLRMRRGGDAGPESDTAA